MKNLIVFFFITLSLASASPLCPGFNQADLIQTGFVQLGHTDQDSSKQCYRVTINYKVPKTGFSTALAFRDFHKFDSNDSLDVFLKGRQIGTENVLGITLLIKNTKWDIVSVSYLVTSRSDILVGSFLADVYQNPCSFKKYHNISGIVPGLVQSNYNYTGSVFISGVDAQGSLLNLKVQIIKIDTNLGRIQLKVNGTNSIALLQISYIIKRNDFPFQVLQSNQDSSKFHDYSFTGLKGYKTSPVYLHQAYNSQKLFCQGSKCNQQCTTVIQCQLEGGIVMQRSCINCQQSEEFKQGSCISKCKVDETYENGKCIRPSCPSDSFWNKMTLECQCYKKNNHVINGKCNTCLINQQWSSALKQCVCSQGTHQVNGQCIQCAINERYNEDIQQCECNYGFFFNQESVLCQSCHPTCGRCTGPNKGQCLQCSDVSYTYKNGFCTRNDPCPVGLYLFQNNCKPCSAYCRTCENENICDKCIEGFEKNQIVYGGVRASFCVEKCGDGKRFEVECDDGNLKNGDGCNSDCEVETGWTCLGGSSIKPSKCNSQPPSKTQVQLTGTVHLFGRIVQGVRLSYIPPQLTANQCASCNNLLWIRVIQSHIIPGMRINYLPKSKYQFLAQFDFNGLFAIPIFTISVQINPDYARYFKNIDLAQIIVKQVDPSTLKVNYQEQTLNLNEVSGNDLDISQNLVEEIFSQ